MDRRNGVQKFSLILLAAAAFVSILGASAVSGPQHDSGTGSLGEHAEVMIKALAFVIISLFSALVGVILWNVKDMKNSIRENHDELKKELNGKVGIRECDSRHGD